MSTAPARREPGAAPPARATGTNIKAMLVERMDQLAAVMPRHMTPAKQIQVVSTLIYRTPRLQECVPATIVAAVMEASELGLSLSKSAGEAYLVPYRNTRANAYECQFQPGYRGLVKLARQSGEVAYVQGRLVREGEEFWCRYTPDLEFRHVPFLDGDSSRPIVGAYAVARLRAGDHLIEWMTADQIEAIHHRSQSHRNALRQGKPEEGPWVDFWDEMAKKTVIRRLAKILPASEELATALEADDRQYEDDEPAEARAVPPGQTRSQALAGRLRGRLDAPPPEPEYRADEGVRRPVYSESEADDDLPAATGRAREPGEDDDR